MNLQKHKILIIILAGTLALIVASPVLQRLLIYPQAEFFTEMWLLGPEHTAENYPFNITLGKNYNVFLGITNNLGHNAQYMIQVKFRNQTQPAADSFNRTPSSLPSLHNIEFSVANQETWELALTFSLDYIYYEKLSQVNFNNIVLTGNTLDLSGYSAALDPETMGFFGNLFFELWIYNDSVGDFQYHERFVSLHLNMTV